MYVHLRILIANPNMPLLSYNTPCRAVSSIHCFWHWLMFYEKINKDTYRQKKTPTVYPVSHIPPNMSRDTLAMSIAFPQEFLLTRETISVLSLKKRRQTLQNYHHYWWSIKHQRNTSEYGISDNGRNSIRELIFKCGSICVEVSDWHKWLAACLDQSSFTGVEEPAKN